ncbi:MAG: hypothetical protein NZ560_04390 [Aquificaceae bacterium]|nr:hypothetical protein [Aquificaceae bacterium]MDW8097448.1 hypothetical protein [Aquificaceae bacterium]
MADLTRAGLDRGDLEKELEHTLVSVRMLHRSYTVIVEDLTQEELLHDLQEYKDQLERTVMPLVRRAESSQQKRLVDLAYELRYTYEKILRLIEERLDSS